MQDLLEVAVLKQKRKGKMKRENILYSSQFHFPPRKEIKFLFYYLFKTIFRVPLTSFDWIVNK